MNIAFFIGDVIQSYEAEVIEKVSEEAKARGHRVDIYANCCVPSSDYLHIEGLKNVFYLANLDQYDGILLADDTLHNYYMNIDLRRLLREKADCPVVCLRNPVEGFYNVITDNREEMRKMTRHILDVHKCTRVGFVTGIMDLDDAKKRLEGFKDAMKESNLPVEDDDIFYGDYWNDQGGEMADYFINRSKGLPEAIICSNDYMATALIQALEQREIYVPEELLVTGVDNIPESRENVPSVTTIDLPIDLLVRKSFGALEALNRGEKLSKTIYYEGRFEYRASCGCTNITAGILHNYDSMKVIIERERQMSKQCVFMSVDFGGVIDKTDCVVWGLRYFKHNKNFKRVYMIVDNCLVGLLDEDKEIEMLSEPVEEGHLLPAGREKELEGCTNAVFPINCKDELYGYIVIQLGDGDYRYFDEVVALLLITLGQTFKRLELLKSLGKMDEVMELLIQDTMTNLYNRRGFERRMKELYDKCGNNKRIVVSSIDIDGLKYINDNFGHFEGDRAIKSVAGCIEAVLREDEFAARTGGDEFTAVTILKQDEKPEDFRDRLYKCIAEKAKEFKDYALSASVGSSEIDSYGYTIEGLKNADKEMYVEKRIHHEKIKR